MNRATIAVVEDNPDNRMLVEAILDELYRLVEFEDGVSAVAGLADHNPDLVLLDISLPGLDGTEVLRTIRADARLASIPVIALTAHAMREDRQRFLDQGFDDYLTKPILDDEGRPRQLPWEDWRDGEDRLTSGWMRATAPSGSADHEGSVAWSGELGYGVRPPEQGQAETVADTDGETAADESQKAQGDSWS